MDLLIPGVRAPRPSDAVVQLVSKGVGLHFRHPSDGSRIFVSPASLDEVDQDVKLTAALHVNWAEAEDVGTIEVTLEGHLHHAPSVLPEGQPAPARFNPRALTKSKKRFLSESQTVWSAPADELKPAQLKRSKTIAGLVGGRREHAPAPKQPKLPVLPFEFALGRTSIRDGGRLPPSVERDCYSISYELKIAVSRLGWRKPTDTLSLLVVYLPLGSSNDVSLSRARSPRDAGRLPSPIKDPNSWKLYRDSVDPRFHAALFLPAGDRFARGSELEVVVEVSCSSLDDYHLVSTASNIWLRLMERNPSRGGSDWCRSEANLVPSKLHFSVPSTTGRGFERENQAVYQGSLTIDLQLCPTFSFLGIGCSYFVHLVLGASEILAEINVPLVVVNAAPVSTQEPPTYLNMKL